MNGLQLGYLVGFSIMVVVTLVVYYWLGPFGPTDLNQ